MIPDWNRRLSTWTKKWLTQKIGDAQKIESRQFIVIRAQQNGRRLNGGELGLWHKTLMKTCWTRCRYMALNSNWWRHKRRHHDECNSIKLCFGSFLVIAWWHHRNSHYFWKIPKVLLINWFKIKNHGKACKAHAGIYWESKKESKINFHLYTASNLINLQWN